MSHDQVLELLPDLLRSQLSESARVDLTLHLDECAECSDALRTLQLVAEPFTAAAASGASAHPTSSDIVDFALDTPSLSDPDRVRVASHLEECAACRLQVESTRDAEAALADPARGLSPGHGALAFLTRGGARTALPWAATVLLAAVLVYPAFLGAFRLPAARRTIERLQGERAARQVASDNIGAALPLTLLRSPLRGEAPGAAVSLQRGEHDAPAVALGVEFLLPEGTAAEAPVRFELITGDGSVAWEALLRASEVERSLRTTGTVVLVVPTARLGDGRHELRVILAAQGERVDELARIPFSVRRDQQDSAARP